MLVPPARMTRVARAMGRTGSRLGGMPASSKDVHQNAVAGREEGGSYRPLHCIASRGHEPLLAAPPMGHGTDADIQVHRQSRVILPPVMPCPCQAGFIDQHTLQACASRPGPSLPSCLTPDSTTFAAHRHFPPWQHPGVQEAVTGCCRRSSGHSRQLPGSACEECRKRKLRCKR